ARANKPDLISIPQQAIAAGYDVGVARAGRLPKLSGVASGNYVNVLRGTEPNPLTGNSIHTGTSTNVGLNASVPIFQGGLPAARIRQAQAQQGQVLEQVVGTERAVVQTTRSAYANYDAAQRAIQAETVAVQA